MSEGKLRLPDQRNYKYALDTALEIASRELSELKDIKKQCQKSGADYSVRGGKGTITLGFLGRNYRITLPNVDISVIGESKSPSTVDKLLILHYLLNARGNKTTVKNISFRELPEGFSYYPSFYKRAVKPLVKHFGDEPKKLLNAASGFDTRIRDYGDASVTIKAFEKVPVTLILWSGDSEFEADGSILFDSTIKDYLPTEDIVILCQILVHKLITSSKV